jgi:adenosine deaminase
MTCADFMLNGLDAAWIDDSTRRAWRAEHLAQFDTLRMAAGTG